MLRWKETQWKQWKHREKKVEGRNWGQGWSSVTEEVGTDFAATTTSQTLHTGSEQKTRQ